MTRVFVFLLLLALIYSCSAPNPQSTSSNDLVKIYVSKNGQDSNNGDKSSPLFSIDKAIEKAYSSSSSSFEIYLENGEYKINDGVSTTVFITNKIISLKGGWNSDFSEVTGVSTINLSNISKQGIIIENTSDVTIENISILNAKTLYSIGGGIRIRNSSNILLTNVLVSNSTSLGGGGISLENVSSSKFYVTLHGNISYGPGGGMLITNSHLNEIVVSSISNSSTSYGGGLDLENSANNRLDLNLVGNQASLGGGISLIGNKTTNNNVFGNISGNSSSSGGGGIYISKVGNNFISALIQGNSSPLGAGISINSIQGPVILSESIITNNQSSGPKKSVIYITNSIPSLTLIIDRCQIGGTSSSLPNGIYEDTVDLSGHTIINNIFFTNTLANLYNEPDGTIDINSISTLNTSSTLHDASMALGNIASNL